MGKEKKSVPHACTHTLNIGEKLGYTAVNSIGELKISPNSIKGKE